MLNIVKLLMVRSEVHRLVGFMMFMFLLEQGVCRVHVLFGKPSQVDDMFRV